MPINLILISTTFGNNFIVNIFSEGALPFTGEEVAEEIDSILNKEIFKEWRRIFLIYFLLINSSLLQLLILVYSFFYFLLIFKIILSIFLLVFQFTLLLKIFTFYLLVKFKI